MTIKTLSVRCPSCQKEVLMTPAFPDRPFCSRRCKLIDLGEWASEGHRIAGDPVMGDMQPEDELDQER